MTMTIEQQIVTLRRALGDRIEAGDFTTQTGKFVWIYDDQHALLLAEAELRQKEKEKP